MFLKKINRICNVCQQLNNTNVIDCKYHAFLNVLNVILLDKCIFSIGKHGTEVQDFYALLSSQNQAIVKQMYLFISINL